MPRDPRKAAKYSEDQIKALVKNSKLMQEIHETDLPEYRLIMAQAAEDGLGGSGYFIPERDLPKKKVAGVLTQDQILAMQAVSDAECRKLFVDKSADSKNNAARLAAENPSRYRLAKISASARGYLPETDLKPLPQPKPVEPEDKSVPLSNYLCEKLNLPPGSRAESWDAQQALVARLAAAEKAELAAANKPVETLESRIEASVNSQLAAQAAKDKQAA